VIADHLRSTAFLIADGVMPSNEGRGYVLRRIMRRAMRHAHQLGAQDPVMHRLVAALVRQMGAHYPELVRAQALITETLKLEETRFRQTLDRGLRLLEDELARLPEGAALPGAAAFRLYDTYGFPLDLTQDALRESGRAVDVAGFEQAMAEQKAKARAAWAGSGETREAAIWFDLAEEHGATEFLGYDTEAAEGQILALVRDGAALPRAEQGESRADRAQPDPVLCRGRRPGGRHRSPAQRDRRGKDHRHATGAGRVHPCRRGDRGHARAGAGRRTGGRSRPPQPIRANHSATHLLHEALRQTLGGHVAQRGSLNAPDRLRFDFSHGAALSEAERDRVEAEVNAYIRQNAPVETRIMAPDAAQALGAQALFGEKYGDEVRVVSMGRQPGSGRGLDGETYSIELCGGTHVRRTGEIGLFVITGEAASSAGVRRVEALTGEAARRHLTGQAARIEGLARLLKTPAGELETKLRALTEERRALQGELTRLRRERAAGGSGGNGVDNGPDIREINGIRFAAQVLSGVGGKDLPPLIDALKARIGSGAILLVADAGGKAAIAAGVTDDLTGRLSAVDMVRAAAVALGGKGGGGRPDMAQAGGADPSRARAAIEAVEHVIKG
jgi:alanyl-tRNA synthetase